MVAWFIVYYCGLIFLTVGNARLRLPLMPFILIGCAFFIVALYDKKHVCALKTLFRNTFFVLAICAASAVSIYKFREIAMTPVEVYLQRIELCNELGFHRTALSLLPELKGYKLSDAQEERLGSAAIQARRSQP
jgi:hypothetical protein